MLIRLLNFLVSFVILTFAKFELNREYREKDVFRLSYKRLVTVLYALENLSII